MQWKEMYEQGQTLGGKLPPIILEEKKKNDRIYGMNADHEDPAMPHGVR